jgi:hypothetical protein
MRHGDILFALSTGAVEGRLLGEAVLAELTSDLAWARRQ